MGELQAWQPQSNDVAIDIHALPSPSEPSNPHPAVIKAESWQRAEQATQEIVQLIQPTQASEQRRKAVVEYVQNIVRRVLGAEVLSFGSVPLKTYLPDGDIDLTALDLTNSEDSLACKVCSALEAEHKNKDAEFEVKDVEYIPAEVRLVKCLIQNIVVDISFNQIGGLCTLCFLEEVDCLIGKNHLFKRSVILIKAWCYHESRILGAPHALISTYALEILVLYIFHLFHSSLDGPLAVLYRFLNYYSKFDWDNFCVSLWGPVPVSSLPELVAEEPENEGGNLLLSKEFLRNCVDRFPDPLRGSENNSNSSRSFPQKHLNIVDPLKENNNLGRSVSKGNFYRIRSAFAYGARNLEWILLGSSGTITREVYLFFKDTMDRHGSGERPDVQDAPCTLDSNGLVEGNIISIRSLSGNARDLANARAARSVRAYHAPHLFFQTSPRDSAPDEVVGLTPKLDPYENKSSTSSTSLTSNWSTSQAECEEVDLTGDSDLHLEGLLYAKGFRDYLSSTVYLPLHRSSPSGYQDIYTHYDANGVVPGPPFSSPGCYPVNLPLRSGAYGMEDIPKPRGTGTYFPNARAYRERQSLARGRNPAPLNQLPRTGNNNWAETTQDTNIREQASQDPTPQAQPSISSGTDRGKTTQPEGNKSSCAASMGSSHANSILFPSVGKFKFGSSGPGTVRASAPELGGTSQGSGPSSPAPPVQRSVTSSKTERPGRSYQLKNEEDFPPLAG